MTYQLGTFFKSERPIEQLYFKIREVESIIQVGQSVIRFWCKEFGIEPKRDNHRHRKFTKFEIEKLRVIKKLLYVDKYRIDGAKEQFKIIFN